MSALLSHNFNLVKCTQHAKCCFFIFIIGPACSGITGAIIDSLVSKYLISIHRVLQHNFNFVIIMYHKPTTNAGTLSVCVSVCVSVRAKKCLQNIKVDIFWTVFLLGKYGPLAVIFAGGRWANSFENVEYLEIIDRYCNLLTQIMCFTAFRTKFVPHFMCPK